MEGSSSWSQSKRGSLRSALVVACLALLVFPSASWAQGSAASINGTVKDPTGAVVPEATITLTNTQTNVAQTAATNATGEYVIQNILPGSYLLKAAKEGFQTVTQPAITLEVNQTTTFDFTLPVGATTQTVTVEAAAAALETSTAEIGSVVTVKMVNDLPLNGRNFTQLLELTPGVSPISTAQNSGGWGGQPLGSYTFPSVNGQSNRSNLFLMDGVSNQGEFESTYNIAPQIDDIEEFKVQSHNDEAQFGGALGGIVNLVTKGGTNSVHEMPSTSIAIARWMDAATSCLPSNRSKLSPKTSSVEPLPALSTFRTSTTARTGLSITCRTKGSATMRPRRI